jgi:hypothetical protein
LTIYPSPKRGEPLLHPNLDTVLRESRRFWPRARLDLLTNGLLFPKQPHILPLLKEMNGYVFISRHFHDAEYLRFFEESLQCLRESGVPFTISPNDRDWRKYYMLDAEGHPVPYDSDPERAWNNCCTKNGCPSLMGNRLYKCAHMAYALLGYRRGMIPDSWKMAASYRPLEADCDSRSLLAHLASEAVPECRICPERYEYVPLEEKHIFPHCPVREF